MRGLCNTLVCKLASLLIGVLALASCGPGLDQQLQQNALNKSHLQWTPESETAIVLGSVDWPGSVFDRAWFYFEADVGSATEAKSSEKPFILNRERFFATDAGSYSLGTVIARIYGDMYHYRFEGWDREEGPIGIVTVDPGEIIYIGHIEVQPSGLALRLRVEDQFGQFVAHKLPEILKPYKALIKKELIDVPELTVFATRTKMGEG